MKKPTLDWRWLFLSEERAVRIVLLAILILSLALGLWLVLK